MTRQRVVRVLQILLIIATVAAVGWALGRNGAQAWADVKRANPWVLTAATLMSVIAPWCTMLGWRAMLADLGSRLRLSDAASVFFVGQLGKYLPGSVWSVVAQAEMAQRLGVPRRRTATVGLVGIAMSALSGALVGLPALPLLVRQRGALAGALTVVLMVVIAACLLWPRLLNAILALAFRLLKREPLEHQLTWRGILTTTVWFLLAWLGAGLQLLVLAKAVGGERLLVIHLVVVGICGFALASAIGMMSFILPAGLGLREGMLVLMLAPSTGVTTATVIALLSRFTTTIGDVIVAVGGWLWARSHHLLGEASADDQEPISKESA